MPPDQPPASQYRVGWEDRARYLAVLADLAKAVNRERDAVQVGAPETTLLGQTVDLMWAERIRYRCKVLEAKDQEVQQAARERVAQQTAKLARQRSQKAKPS